MKKIALTTAALLIAASSAYAAGSGQSVKAPGNDITQSAVDTTTTSSIVRDLVGGGNAENAKAQDQSNPDFQQGIYGQGHWGH